MDFGGRIRNLRKEKGIKATELSEKVQISQPYLSQIEHGTKQPPIDVIVNVCKVLNIPLSQFFAEDQENLPSDIVLLIETAKKLSKEELEHLNKFLLSTLERTKEDT